MSLTRFARALVATLMVVIAAAAVTAQPAHAASTATGTCDSGVFLGANDLTVSISAPSRATVGSSVSIVIEATTERDFLPLIWAEVSLAAGSATRSDTLSGTYDASTSFTFKPTRPGVVRVTAVISPHEYGCTIPPFTVNTSITVTAARDTTPPRVARPRNMTARHGSRVVFRVSVSGEASKTQIAIGVYPAASNRPVKFIVTPWSVHRGIVSVPWKIPRSVRPDRYVWCVLASDTAKNVSAGRCAKLSIT